MTPAFDDEVDRLLRRHTPGAQPTRGSEHGREQMRPHLDADTLALYVEQALPPRTHAAHTEHLATCDDCRTHLAVLARLLAPEHETPDAVEAAAAISPAAVATTAQPSTALEQPETSSHTPTAHDSSVPRGWRRLARELFAAPRPAYALPALLLVVAVTSLSLFIRRTEPETIALVTERASPASGAVMNANMNSDMNSNMASGNMASANMNGNITLPAADAPAGTATTTAPSAAMTGNSNSATSNSVPSATGVPATIGAPPASRPASAPPQTYIADASSDVRAPAAPPANQSTNANASMSAAPQTAAGTTRESRSDLATTNDEAIALGAARPSAPTASRPVASESPKRRARAILNDAATDSDRVATPSKKTNVETRVVGDCRFTRRGAAWVDEAHIAGSAVTTVRRNSEQLRALLADEPGLRRIVEALSGELIVVWKGRAYRFR